MARHLAAPTADTITSERVAEIESEDTRRNNAWNVALTGSGLPSTTAPLRASSHVNGAYRLPSIVPADIPGMLPH